MLSLQQSCYDSDMKTHSLSYLSLTAAECKREWVAVHGIASISPSMEVQKG